MSYRSAQPGSAQPGSAQPGPAPQPADGRVRRVRAALVVLFPETPERGTPQPQPEPGHADAARPGGRRAVYVAIEVAAVCTGAAVLLPRIAGVPSWDSVYAEDQGVFLFDALARPWHLLVPFGGYEQLIHPRQLPTEPGGALVIVQVGQYANANSESHRVPPGGVA